MENTTSDGQFLDEFPTIAKMSTPQPMSNGHMTLRDYFAAKAMQGIMSNSSRRIQEIDAIVSDAYDVADAMLKQREL